MQYADSLTKVNSIRTGTFLDKITGIDGIPRGKIVEIYGDPSVGKSTISLQTIAAVQKQGKKCLFADIEWSYDARYAESLGVNNSKLGLIRERFAEDALDAIEKEAVDGDWDLIVLDSIGGLLPRTEAEKMAGEKTIGGQASLVARFCRKIVPILSLKDTSLIVLNHSFTDIMSGKIMTSGGRKLDFHKSFSVRLRAKTGVSLKSGDRVVGKVIIAKVVKNKIGATEGMEVDAQILFGEGFSSSLSLLDTALEKGIIKPVGRKYFLGETHIATGMPKLRDWAKANAELLKESLQ